MKFLGSISLKSRGGGASSIQLAAFHRQSPKTWKAAQKKGAEASISTVWPLAVVIWAEHTWSQ